jgi:hypothetical protein
MEIHITRGDDWDHIKWFNPATFVCLPQVTSRYWTIRDFDETIFGTDHNCLVLINPFGATFSNLPNVICDTEMSSTEYRDVQVSTEMSRILLHTWYCLDLVTSDIYVILKHHSLVYIYMYSANGDPYGTDHNCLVLINPFGATFSNLPNVICDVYFQRHKNRAKTFGKRLIWWESVRPYAERLMYLVFRNFL